MTAVVMHCGPGTNPLEVIEQITYLLFLRRLDELQSAGEAKSTRLKIPIERNFFPSGKDKSKRTYAHYSWQNFKNFLSTRNAHGGVSEHIFPGFEPLAVMIQLTHII